MGWGGKERQERPLSQSIDLVDEVKSRAHTQGLEGRGQAHKTPNKTRAASLLYRDCSAELLKGDCPSCPPRA